MQSSTTSQRSVRRRSPATESGPPPTMGSSTMSSRSMSPGSGPQPRTSSVSTKSSQNGAGSVSRRQIAGQSTQSIQSNSTAPPLSQIEKSVTHLLVATKQLLETLTQWSRHQATDAQVSDVYVRLGYEFNIACRAFTAINVDTSDLGNVPELLRHILESTLSQEASVESLEKYLPRIRDIIINLLHGLKRKQQKLRHKQSRDGTTQSADTILPRNSSVSSVGSTNTGLTTLLDQGLEDSFRDGTDARESLQSSEIPPRMSSASTTRRGLPGRDISRASVSSDQSSLSSTTMQNMPVVPPYPGEESFLMPATPNTGDLAVDSFPPPPPPPKQHDALAALQRGGELERRASRRYSAYHISKHLGAPPNGVPMLPPPQNSPIPNRGRNDARESMRAVQVRGDQKGTRQGSSRLATDVSASPSRGLEQVSKPLILETPSEAPPSDSPTEKTPVDKLRQPTPDIAPPRTILKEPASDNLPSFVKPDTPEKPIHRQVIAGRDSQERQFTPEQSPPLGKELTVFLQYKTKVKKFVFSDGYNELSMARLQLAFIEKFAWNTHNNGVDLPDIYIQDPVSGVRHELEDLNDIKDRSVLALNVEVLDEVKRHFDEGIGSLKKIVQDVKSAVDDQQNTIQRVSERQRDTANEMARMAAAPPPTSSRVSYIETQRPNGTVGLSKVNNQAQVNEIQNLRRDLAVLRQTYSNFQSDIQSSMATIKIKAASVKTVAIKTAIPSVKGDSGRSYVNAGKKQLSEDSDKLVGQVDDLQDIVEDLRKDVVLRGVRPLPRQLESVARDISQATKELKMMQDFLKRERPLWTKIWEKELETVCNDREEMTMQEDLAADLQDDLEKATQTFALVEEATKEQLKDGPLTPGLSSGRPALRGLNHLNTAADPSLAKEGVLGEVRALQPNHANRLEAIERAEKLRQKELEDRRGGELQKELTSFVEKGGLKKSGGFEEVERARKAKDDRIRKEVWERMNGVVSTEGPTAEEENAEEKNGMDPMI